MYTMFHLLSLGFKASAINYHATKGKLNHVARLRPGGARIFSADEILQLGIELNVPVTLKDIEGVRHV